MSFQSSVVVEALQGLERQFGTPRGHLAQVASLVSGGQYEAAREAADKLLRALDVVIATKDLAYLLRAGFAVDDWPEVHTAFAEIVAALAVQIDVESTRQPLMPLPPSHTPESTAARKP